MKKLITGLSLAALFAAVILVACKKNDHAAATNFDTEASTQSDDQSQFSGQIDAVANETNVVLEATGTLASRGETLLCNATVSVDSSNATRTVTINYSGADCFGLYNRTGVVTISIPAGVHWKNAGAAITVTYQNLAVTRIADNRTIVINGSHVITNVSGGLLINLPTLGTITHTITSNGMNITFGNGSQRTWQVARQRVFSFDNGVVVTETGTHTEGTDTHVAEWGTNRFGRAFTSSITQPIVVRQDCNFRITAGQIKHAVPVFTATATFGLNDAGNPTGCPGSGHYYVKVEWTNGTASHSALFPY